MGADNRSFLAVIRSLGRKGYRVHTACCPPGTAALTSKYIVKNHRCQIPNQLDDFEIEPYVQMLQEEHIDLILPCDDPSILVVKHFQRQIEKYSQIYLLSHAVNEIAFSKAKMNQLARSLNIPLPSELYVSATGADIEEVVSKIPAPVVLKPVSSYQSVDLKSRLTVNKAYTEATYREILPVMLLSSDILVQENFVGTGLGVECLALEGELLVTFQHRRVHEPIHGGGSSYRKSEPVDPALYEATARLVKALNYTGVGMFEFKKNDETGAWIFIELNPRFWGSLPLAVASGADFPVYLVEMLLDHRTVFPQSYRSGLYCRYMTQDVQWFKENLKADRTDPQLASLPLSTWMLEGLNVLAFKERNDTWALDDPRPFFVEIGQIFGKLFVKIVRKLALLMLKSSIVQRRKVRVIKRKAAEARSMMFICGGNICRSVFAHYAVERDTADGVSCLSAGCYATPGRRPPDMAIEIAAGFHLDIRNHEAKRVHQKDLEHADLIFYFDENDVQYLLDHYAPECSGKLFPLGLLIGQHIIKDPYSLPKEGFREIYAQIYQCIQGITG